MAVVMIALCTGCGAKQTAAPEPEAKDSARKPRVLIPMDTVYSATRLIRQGPVQDELNLTEDQKDRIEDVATDFRRQVMTAYDEFKAEEEEGVTEELQDRILRSS
jgi:Spy/CpxP family protein refolding chaperone